MYYSLKAGRWPGDDPEVYNNGSGIAVIGSAGAASKPPSKADVEALRIVKELDYRLGLCGVHGEIVKWRYADNKSVKELCHQFDIGRQYCYHLCQRVMKYIIGKRMRIPYSQFKGG